ncbi:MAG: hypothetical protein H6729_00780 [Deltaproteobacteria bacterium]|nr:hypothetical protein [Deltaproteobacteria bacterium]
MTNEPHPGLVAGPRPSSTTGPTQSPLWLLTKAPAVTRLVESLTRIRRQVEAMPSSEHTLTLSKTALAEARTAFDHMILGGEAALHRLSELLSEYFFGMGFERESVVIGEVPTTKERFRLTQPLSAGEIYGHTDIDLGTRQLARIRVHDGTSLCRPELIANFVEYHPIAPNTFEVHRLVSRIKAEEEIWNKVVDELFNIDNLVRRDKKLQSMSRYVKDVFGLKIIVANADAARRLFDTLGSLTFEPDRLGAHTIEANEGNQTIRVIELKDYLSDSDRKQSGWAALKCVAVWWDRLFEIQVQPLANYYRERERITQESHESFRARREMLRGEIARQVPLFGYYRDLLKWLFLGSQEAPPEFPGVRLEISP